MSSTNKTTYYELPQFVDNDIFNPLVDDNDAYAKIDTALHNIANAEADDASEIVGIKSRLDSAEGDIDTLEAQNGNSVLTTTAQTLSGAVNELDADASALDGRLDVVEDDINNVATGLKVKVTALETQNGSEVLTTTAQTLSGAVNEVYSKLKKGFVTPEMFGAVGDGITDDTNAIQDAVDACDIVVFGNKTYLINHDGISLNSGNRIIMGSNTVIKMEATNSSTYNMFKVWNVNDVVISGGIIDGSKDTHIGDTGEQGHCIKIGGSKNVVISNVKMINAWGDGITSYVYNNVTPENILVENCEIAGVRRNGSSITSGRNIKFVNVVIHDIGGTSPESGIDVEPNVDSTVVENIIFENAYIYDTNGASILIDLHSNQKHFNIKVVGGRLEGREGIACQGGYAKVDGIIKIEGTSFKNNAYAFYVRNWEHDAGKIIVKDTVAEVTYSGTDQWSTTPYTMYYGENHDIDSFGNVYLDNVDVIYLDGATGTGYDIGLVNFVNATYEDFYLLNNKLKNIAGYDRFTNIIDVKKIEFANNYVYTYPSNALMYCNLITNYPNAGVAQIKLANSVNLYENQELEFIVKQHTGANDGLEIVPDTGVTFPSDYPLGLWSKTLGSSVKFRYINNSWQIVSMRGTWTAVV